MATVEEATAKVQRILVGAFNNVGLTQDGFRLIQGSTAIHVRIREFGKDPDGNPSSIVYLWAPVARELAATPEFYKWAATDGQQKYIGGISVIVLDSGALNVIFDHAILADYLDPAELISAVSLVGSGADEMDDIVHDKFGGRRYIDE